METGLQILPIISVLKKKLSLSFIKEIYDERMIPAIQTEEGDTNCRLSYHTHKNYCGIIALAGIIAKLEKEQKTISLRDVYYTLKGLFRNQNECNSMILLAGKMFQLKRHQMRIVPGTRGSVAGNFKFRFPSESYTWVDCSTMSAQGGFPISNAWTLGIEVEIVSQALYLIVVEKEGVYKRLCEDEFCSRNRCILVTGCGYPDVATRAIVHHLSHCLPYIKVLGICDFNPHGVSLLLTYKFGSNSMSFEGEGFEVKQLKWVGLRMKQLQEIDLHDSCYERLSDHDRRKISWLLEQEHIEPEYKDEIKKWLTWNRKYELESLYTLGIDALSNFFEKAVKGMDYI